MSKMVTVLAGAIAASLLFVSCNSGTPKFAFKHAEKRGTLQSNGLKFVLMPDETTQLVEVDVRYDVGSREDPPGKAGLAHLVEHMMFQQRPDGAGTPPLMESINDISTFFNAYTNWDSTHYMTTGRMENLDALLKIEAMRMYYGCQTVSEAEFLREREVVRNEIRQRQGTAEGQIPQIVLSSIYPKGHAYERMIGGDDGQLTTITLNDACEFMKSYYTPSAATVIVAGGFDVDKTAEAVQKWFGKLEKRTAAARVEVKPFTVTKDTKTVELDVERAQVIVAWALPPSNTPEGEAARYGLGNAFGKIQRASADYDFAYSVTPMVLGGQLAPVFAISIELKGMGKLNEALDFMWKSAKSAYRGFDEGSYEDIEEQKNRQKADFIAGLEQLQARTNAIGDLVQFSRDFDFSSPELYIFHELDKIAKWDGEAISNAIKKVADPEKARVVIIKPNKEGIKGDKRSTVKFAVTSGDEHQVANVDPREAKRPIKMAAELKTLNTAKRFQLANGMNVVLLPLHSMPLVSARLIFNNVGDALLPDSAALPSLAAGYLSLPLDAEAFGRTGVEVGCRSSMDATTCSSNGMAIYLDVILKGLERLIVAGEYRQEAVENWQKRARENLKTKSQQQEDEFDRQFATAVFGPDHPYTKTAILTADHINKVSKDSLQSFRKTHYSAGNATLVVVGDFDPAKAESAVRGNFGAWGRGTVDKAVEATQVKRTGPAYIGVAGKDDPQLNVQIAFPAPAGIDGQEGAREVLAAMLNIRIADIRFKLGSTYGIASGRRPRKGPTAYMVSGTVDAERGGESIKAMRTEIDNLRKGSTFDVDFVRARRKLISDLLGESTVTGELAGRLAFIGIYGLEPTYYNTLLQQIAAVSPAQVRALIGQELNPNNEVLVVLGGKASLDKAFAEAGIKDVKIVEPEYK
ncbi:MAG: insulinase family protein [Deltaproteobacteria bacterium]|nr:insulinase family protein [Deltaproteobacteria bacterium]